MNASPADKVNKDPDKVPFLSPDTVTTWVGLTHYTPGIKKTLTPNYNSGVKKIVPQN